MSKKKKADTAILEVMLLIGVGSLLLGYWAIIGIIAILIGIPFLLMLGDDDE